MKQILPFTGLDTYRYGFKDPDRAVYKIPKGLSKAVVEEISSLKGEPSWMREFRLRALEIFEKKPMPTWGADLSSISFDDIYYYVKPSEKKVGTGTTSPKILRGRLIELEYLRQRKNSLQASVPSMIQRSFITNSRRCGRKRE